MKTFLVCIAKNEDDYIGEWCAYHRLLGFDEIWVYQNDWRWEDAPRDEWLRLMCMDGDEMQLPSYNEFLREHYGTDGFAAFFDVDEYLVTPGMMDVHKWLERFKNHRAVAVNWRLFGDSWMSGHDVGDSVLERFTYRQSGFNEHVKTIVNLSFNSGTFNNPHFIRKAAKHDFTIHSDGKRFVRGPYCETRDSDAWLNHYYCKTWGEYQRRIPRGGADVKQREYSRELFDRYNLNEVKDFTARDFIRHGAGVSHVC